MGARRARIVGAIGATALVAGLVVGVPAAAQAAVNPKAAVIIDEVYGAGGNAGAVYNRDYIELHNRSAAATDLTGWAVQYKSATGTTWSRTLLTGSIQAGGFLIVGGGNGGSNGSPLPRVDVGGSINLGTAAGTVALTSTATVLSCTTAACATTAAVVDLVGYGTTANTFAGTAPTPAPSATLSVSRSTGHLNTANNAVDFAAEKPTPTVASGRPDVIAPLKRSIAEIQGLTNVSPVAGATVVTDGVVTASYPTGGYQGFTIQTIGTGGEIDSKHVTSDGIFVYSPSTVESVKIGEHVQVTGVVSESFGLTQVTVADAGSLKVLDAGPIDIASAELNSWPTTATGRESIESMLYLPQGDFTITDTYPTNQYGEVGLASGDGPLIQPTDAFAPNSAEALGQATKNAGREVVLNDGASTDFLNAANSDQTPPYVSLTDPVRVGALTEFHRPVVVTYRNSLWKLDPTGQVTPEDPKGYPATFVNNRTEAPDRDQLGSADVTVASFNVLNYFTTLGVDDKACVPYTDRAGDGVTVKEGCPQRGAWDKEDFQRQQDKIVAAINALDADVVGLMEIENSAVIDGVPDEAVATLVKALNSATGTDTWSYVPSSKELPELSLQDAIANAIIYRNAVVIPQGASRALGTESDKDGAFANAREPIGQVFASVDKGAPFFFVVNHFKSKGSAGPWDGDVDSGDGQGASNESRTRQAMALRDWLRTIPDITDSVVLAGDFNSYRYEDPLQTLYDAGYTDAGKAFAPDEYSYSFDGLSGSLDHILVNHAALSRSTGADIWNINAPESVALEYSRYNNHGTLFYDPNPYRSSDHDPVLLGLRNEGGVQASATLSSVLADITTAYVDGSYEGGVYVGVGPDPTTGRGDQTRESTLGNMVANFLVASLSPEEHGGAGIGVINPEALDSELLLAPDGVITEAEADAVLPDTNPLYTLRLTGAQFTTMLEQQWRPGSFLALGLSENVTYSYDPAAPDGSHITSVTIDNTPIDPAGIYRIGTTAYLASGGDGFDVLAQGDRREATTLHAQQAWHDYLGASYGWEANYAQQGVGLADVPTTVPVGGELTFSVTGLNLTSLGAPLNIRMGVYLDGDQVVQVPVSDGAAEVSITVPEWMEPGPHLMTLRAKPSGTLVSLPFTIVEP